MDLPLERWSEHVPQIHDVKKIYCVFIFLISSVKSAAEIREQWRRSAANSDGGQNDKPPTLVQGSKAVFYKLRVIISCWIPNPKCCRGTRDPSKSTPGPAVTKILDQPLYMTSYNL